MSLTLNIAENFKKSGLKKYDVFNKPLEKFLKVDDSNNINSQKLLKLLKDYEMIMIGYKSEIKIIDKEFIKGILKYRKQKPVFLVDCGIPGNIYVDVGMINNFLFDLNDLEQLYSSWIENISINENANNELYDVELKSLLDELFKKLELNLNQKMLFEQIINNSLRSGGDEIKLNLKSLLKLLNKSMQIKKLENILANFSNLEERLNNVSGEDINEYAKISKEYSDLKPLVEKSKEFIKLNKEMNDTEELIAGSDLEIKKEAEEEKERLKKILDLEKDLKIMLIPKDFSDERNAIVEIRAGTGGEGSSSFCFRLIKNVCKIF